jgi:hypothetical protein
VPGDVARRYGVARQTVHDRLRKYAAEGLGGLADRSSRPLSCPHQMDPVVEARVVEMRRAHPGWGPRTILFWLERDGVVPVPGRTSVERCLVRQGLVTPATGYGNAQVAEKRLGNAVLLTVDGWGHPSYQVPSACIDQWRVRYLVDLVTPPRGTVCQPDQIPFG